MKYAVVTIHKRTVEIVEDTVEHHFCQQELVSCRYLTRDTTLELDHIVSRAELQSTSQPIKPEGKSSKHTAWHRTVSTHAFWI